MSTKGTKGHGKDEPPARRFSFVPFAFFVDQKFA